MNGENNERLAGHNLSRGEAGYGWKLFAVKGGRWGHLTDKAEETYFIAKDMDQAVAMYWDTWREDQEFDMSVVGDEYQLYSVRVVAWHPRIPTEWAEALISAGLLTADP